MQITDETLEVLWLGAGAIALWMLLPAVLSTVGLTIRKDSFDDDPGALEPYGNDTEYEELFTQLRRLGFEPVGTSSSTFWLFFHHWCRNFKSRVFATRRGDEIALAYKLFAWDRWHLCFVTAFTDEAIVETANQMVCLKIEEPDRLRWGLATPDRALLLERHREACRDFASAGSRSVAVLSTEQLLRLTRQHESRSFKRQRWVGLMFMSISLVCLGFVLLLMCAFVETASYLLPVTIIGWGLLWPAAETLLIRAGAGRTRAEDAEDQPITGRPDGEVIVRS